VSQPLAIDRPLVVELFCGSFGWSAGWLARGGRAVGFDIEHLPHHGDVPPGAELVLQDVLTIHGSQFRDAALIVASPPCTEYSYMAMPWSRAKDIAGALRGSVLFPAGYTGSRTIPELNALFDACFRIQREACEAAGRYIPLVVENVKGAQPWVGRAKANYGSYYLWGDVESVGGRIVRSGRVQFGMPAVKAAGRMKSRISCAPRMFSERIAKTAEEAHALHYRLPKDADATKNNGGSWFGVAHNTESGHGQNPVNGVKVPGIKLSEVGFNVAAAQRYREEQGTKQEGSGAEWFDKALDERRKQATATKNGGDWFGPGENCSLQRRSSSRSDSRKAASALIARIPRPLSDHIARIFWPGEAAGD
jgi:hypothetical protein